MAGPESVPNAAEFLARALPWPVEGGPKFFVNVHYRTPKVINGVPIMLKDGRQDQSYPGRACLNVREAAGVTAWANTFENGVGTDIYVCMSGQSMAKEKVNSRGRTYYNAIRKAENAVLHKSFYVDVDVKPGDPSKGYATTAEAAQEFGRIRRAIGLPVPSMVVASGSGGFHAHWLLMEAIPTATWEPLAHQLVAALLANGFKGDTGCTIDAARLLRVPNTFNHKQGGRRPVQIGNNSGQDYFLDAIVKPLEPFKGAAKITTRSTNTIGFLGSPSPRLALSQVTPDSLSAGVAPAAGPVPIADLAVVCPFVAHSLATGGADNTNPLWLATTNIATFTAEGRDAAHWMAQGHPGYTQDSTDELWHRQLGTKLNRNLGWPKCQSIAAQGAPQCKTCPHAGGGKSPFNFIVHTPLPPQVTENEAAVIAASDEPPAPLPQTYSRNAYQQILYTVTDEEGVQSKQLLTVFPFEKPWLRYEPPALMFTTVTGGVIGTKSARKEQICVPFELLYDATTFPRELAKLRMDLKTHEITGVIGFMRSWIEVLKQDTENFVHAAPYGWFRNENNNKISGFSYGGQVWSKADYSRPSANPDMVLDRQYKPTGDIEPWLLASKMLTDQKRPEIDVILATAFASPLVTLVGQTGLLLSTYSAESGIGKTTALRIAQGVWGHPIKAVQSLTDTINSVVKKMGDLKNLPMYWDELKTEADTQRFVQLAFQLSGGKEKSRLSSAIKYHEPGTWELLLCSTSNDSLLNHITAATKTTSAGMARIFEFVVPPGVTGQISPGMAQQILDGVTYNYGHAGLAYAKFLGEHYAKVEAEVKDKLYEIEKAHKATAEERYWLAMVTVLMMGAKYGNQLKLTNIDEKALYTFLIGVYTAMRQERKDSPVDLANPTSMLGHIARYLNVKRPHNTIVTNLIHSGSGRPPQPGMPGAIVQRMDPNHRVDEVQVQFATDTSTVRMFKAPFMDWLAEQKLSQRLVLQKLKNTFNIKEVRGRLGAGTARGTMQEVCLEFWYGDPVFNGYIEI